MKLTNLGPADYRVSTWSGGETRELYLSPTQGVYELGKFDFRLSNATVELAETIFTSLPGYQRLIMSLDNPLKLSHYRNGVNEVVELQPFKPYYFLGSEQTKSIGMCQDFNLIYQEGLLGELLTCYQNDSVDIDSAKVSLIYAFEEVRVAVYRGNQVVSHSHLKSGCSVVIDEVTESCRLILTAKQSTEKPIAVVASISGS